MANNYLQNSSHFKAWNEPENYKPVHVPQQPKNPITKIVAPIPVKIEDVNKYSSPIIRK